MSAESVARWNAIPLDRPQPDQIATASSLLKRPRPQYDGDDDESEDNVSLVSRSPSPLSPDDMDIDKYDEYYEDKPEREVITVETKIKSSNVGFSILAKMGWVEGSPLGLSGDGRVEPVPFYVKNDLTGLGKANQDVRIIESTVAQRRELDSERQTKETEDQRRQRENAVAKRAAVKSEISSVLRPFYCEVCDKQFQNVAQYDEHTNSYAHHHKVRFRDMQAAQRASRNTEEEVSKRKEKERKREEKELRKLAKAAGIKMVKPPPLAAVSDTTSAADAANDSKSSELRQSSWAAVAKPASTVPATQIEPTKHSGWAAVGEASSPSNLPGRGGGGWAPVAPPPLPITTVPLPPLPSQSNSPRVYNGGAPSFRTGGWTSLETTSGPLPPPPLSQPSPAVAALPPLLNEPPSTWATSASSSGSGEWNGMPPQPESKSAPPRTTVPQLSALPQVEQQARRESSRSGWQKFRAGAPGRRR